MTQKFNFSLADALSGLTLVDGSRQLALAGLAGKRGLSLDFSLPLFTDIASSS